MSTSFYGTQAGSVLIKPETVFGNLSGSGSTLDLTPATGFFSSGAYSVPFEMASVVELAPLTIDRDEMKVARGQTKPDVAGVYDSGSKVAVRRGEVTFSLKVRTLGTSTSDEFPLHILAASMMSDSSEPSSTTDAVQTYHGLAGVEDQWHFYPTDASLYSEGQVVTVDVSGRPYALYVVEVSDDTPGEEYIVVEGAPRHLTDGDTIRFTRQFENKAPGASFAMRFDKEGYRAECFGCRVTGITGTTVPVEDSSVLVLEFTIFVSHLRYDHSNASTTAPVYPTGGKEVQVLGSTFTTTAALPAPGTTPPYKNATVSDIFVGSYGLSMTAIQQQVPDHRSVVAGELNIADIDVEQSVRLSRPQTGFDDDLVTGVDRLTAVCLGTVGAGSAIAIVIPNAFNTADPGGRTEEGENIVQTLVQGAQAPRGCATVAFDDSSVILAVVH